MKHIKLFENFLLKEKKEELILYHGGLDGDPELNFVEFNKFHDKTSYFTDNPNFAYWYANQKAMDNGSDSDIIMYKCKFKGNLFDAKNKEDMDKLIPLIPEETEVHHGTAWFMSRMVPKKEMIKILQGVQTIQPYEGIENPEIGKKIPNPEYNRENLIIVDFDEDWIYLISENDYNTYLEDSKLGYGVRNKFGEVFEPYREAIINWYKKVTNSTEVPRFSKFGDYLSTIEYAARGYSINYVEPYAKGKQDFKLEESDKLAIKEIYNKCVEKFKEKAYKEMPRKKWTRKEIEVEHIDFWNYYETEGIEDNIKKLGYDGYMAKETFQGKTYNSYAIYDPSKTIEIIKKERA